MMLWGDVPQIAYVSAACTLMIIHLLLRLIPCHGKLVLATLGDTRLSRMPWLLLEIKRWLLIGLPMLKAC